MKIAIAESLEFNLLENGKLATLVCRVWYKCQTRVCITRGGGGGLNFELGMDVQAKFWPPPYN